MPEGDTVYRTAANLHTALAGHRLTGCDIRVPRFAAVDLTGEHVDSVVSRGKHLLIRIGTCTIHSHLKMEGTWHLYAPGGRWRRPAHQVRIVLRTAERIAVGFSLGQLNVVGTDEEDDIVGHLGPDLLGDDWDPGRASAAVASDPALPIAVALLDQRNLAGIGNVYANEVCFVSGIHPASPVSAVGGVSDIVTLARRMLRANAGRVQRCTTGDLRRGHEVWVYGRVGQPCRRCGTPISEGELAIDALTSRVTYWCSRCQPAP